MRITDSIAATQAFSQLKNALRTGRASCALFGVPQSLKPHIIGALSKKMRKSVIVVCASDEIAQAHAEAQKDALYLPKRALQLRASVARSRETMFHRISAISALALGNAKVVFLSEEALAARLTGPELFLDAHIHIKKDGVYDPEKLIHSLVLCGYERVSAVETSGQAARRGEILDVFCPGAAAPYRIDFFDTVVETIRSFDPSTQRRGRESYVKVVLPPAVDLTLNKQAAQQVASYFTDTETPNALLAQRFEHYAQQMTGSRYK